MSEPLTIVFHPAKQHPIKAAILGVVLGIAFRALWQALEPLTAVMLVSLLLATVRDFFLETQYRFDEEEISVRGVLKASRSYPWRRFRTFIKDRNGLFLSPYSAKHQLDQQRGVFLPLTSEQRDLAARYCQSRELARRAA